MFTKKISCYYHEKEIGPKSFIKGSLAHWFYIVHFYTEINCVQLKAITFKCTSQTNLIATKSMYKEKWYCSYGKLQHSIMYWGILKKMDYTGPDLKKKPTWSMPPP